VVFAPGTIATIAMAALAEAGKHVDAECRQLGLDRIFMDR